MLPAPSLDGGSLMVALLAAEKELHVICKGTLPDVHHAMTKVTEFLRIRAMPKEQCEDLLLALSEALSNISRHGYQHQIGAISFTIIVDQDAIRCCVIDTGCGFDPSDQGHMLPDPTALQEGGYGWFIIRSLAAQINYARANGLNRLCFSIPMCCAEHLPMAGPAGACYPGLAAI
jgi:serine/threonine-protein kinase RsbW